MLLTKLKTVTAVVVMVSHVLMMHSALAQRPTGVVGEKANQPIAEALRTLQGHTAGVCTVAFSPDGKTLASASEDMTIKLWDAATGKERATLQGHTQAVVSLAYSPDGKTLASGGNDGTVKLWDVATGKERATLQAHQGHFITFVSYSPDGKTLASRSCGSKVKLWEAATGKERATFDGCSVAYSPDGKTLASTGEDEVVELWDVATGTKRATLQGHTDILSVAYSQDGKTLASASADKTVKLWEVATGRERATLQGHLDRVFFVLFSPDGKTLTTGDKSVKLWDLATGKERATLQGQDGQVRMVYSPDGKILAMGSQDNSVKLWDVATGKVRATLQGHRGAVVIVVFSPDGKFLASASLDKTVKLWAIPAAQKAELTRSNSLVSEDLDSLWTTLASDDAVKAYQAIGKLVAAPDQAVPLAKKRLQPASKSNADIARWITDLDSDDFSVREKASEALGRMGEQAEAALRKELTRKPSPEVRQRIEELLTKIAQPSSESLRNLRAVEVLEQIGNSESKKVLETLAGGDEGFRLTKEAKASLERLNKRAAAVQ